MNMSVICLTFLATKNIAELFFFSQDEGIYIYFCNSDFEVHSFIDQNGTMTWLVQIKAHQQNWFMVMVITRYVEFCSVSSEAHILSLRNDSSSCLDFLAKHNYFHTILKSHIALTMVTKQFVYSDLRQTVASANLVVSSSNFYLI